MKHTKVDCFGSENGNRQLQCVSSTADSCLSWMDPLWTADGLHPRRRRPNVLESRSPKSFSWKYQSTCKRLTLEYALASFFGCCFSECDLPSSLLVLPKSGFKNGVCHWFSYLMSEIVNLLG